MPLEQLFRPLRCIVDDAFDKAKSDAGPQLYSLKLEIEEESYETHSNTAEFIAIGACGPVRITWNGVASLWAFCQGAGRLISNIKKAKEQKIERLFLESTPEVEQGLNSLELARRFFNQSPPEPFASSEHWPSWAPPIDPDPSPESENALGNRFFTGAISWILRHEIAHIALKHSVRQQECGLTSIECEREADREATRWWRGSYMADSERAAGVAAGPEEIRLEWRAIAVGIGLAWVAMVEADFGVQGGKTHPPPAERIFDCFGRSAVVS